METKIYWQIYENKATGEKVKFRRLKHGKYESEKGDSISLFKLASQYNYLGWNGGVKTPAEMIVTPNGFKVRVTKAMKRNGKI